jgi:DNA (cytosine-5)-methyltransferase 1
VRPRLLDLFCGAGGCSVGYHRAGFDVVGVDIAVQPYYPFFDVIQGDALAVLDDLEYVRSFDAIHASPPCQAHSAITKMWDPSSHRDMIQPVREGLIASGLPWVMENVPGAPLLEPVVLCGSMFGLGTDSGELRRHRLFESNVSLAAPGPDACGRKPAIGVHGHPGGSSLRDGEKFSLDDWRTAMGLPHMTAEGLAQAIPPAYTQWLGGFLMAAIEERAA